MVKWSGYVQQGTGVQLLIVEQECLLLGKRRHRRSGEYQAQSFECSEKQSTTHFTSLPCIATALSPACGLQNSHELSCLSTTRRRAEVGMGHPKKETECSTSAQSAGSDDKRPDKDKCERVSPKNEAASNTAAKSAGSDDGRPVLPRLRAAAKRYQLICGSLSLWDWLTPATVSSTATQTMDDGRSLHQLRPIQVQYWTELQKVQHSIQDALNKRRDSWRSSLTSRQQCWNRWRSAFTTLLRT